LAGSLVLDQQIVGLPQILHLDGLHLQSRKVQTRSESVQKNDALLNVQADGHENM
jgi:hypothetical protein